MAKISKMATPTPTLAVGAPVITDEVRKVASLVLDPRNARKHSEAQISQIVLSIEQFGYVDKVVIKPNGEMIAGEGRVLALKRMGRDEVECRVVAGLSPAQYTALAIALNRIPENSSWDDTMLRDLLADLQQDGLNPLSIGFSPGELSKIFADAPDLEVKEIETGPVDDEFWISVRGPLKHQAHALKTLQAGMKPFDGVTVEQGTISLG
jgi:hypothetical protein